MKKLLLCSLVCASVLSIDAQAQLTLTGTSYQQNFNNLATGLPTGWSLHTAATATALGNDVSSNFIATVGANTAWAVTGGGFKNAASATGYTSFAAGTVALQTADTNRALAVRQVGNTNATFPGSDSGAAFVLTLANTAGLTNFNLDFKLQSLDSTSPRTTLWKVEYGVGASPTTFTSITTTGTATTGGNTFGSNTVTANFGAALNNITGPVCIRIVTLNVTTGTGNRPTSAIDDVHLTWTGSGTATNINAINYSPSGNSVPLTTNTLAVKFDNPIAKGLAGNIVLMKSGSVTPSIFDITSAAVTVSDSTATVSGITLENASTYFVLMTPGAFTKTGGTLPCLAIDDSTTWRFSTVDTVTPPPPTPLTALNETFTGCTSAAMGVFVQHSTFGDKRWNCSVFAHNDSNAVYINAGSSSGSQLNADWLITSAPLDFSAMSNPTLSFWQKRRFDGNVDRKLLYSTDFTAGTDPLMANWNELAAAQMAQKPEGTNVWSQVSGISLNSIKGTPFYLAFTYECGTDSAYELTYDDIVVENVNSIFTPNNNQIDVKVLGDANGNLINLGINFKKSAPITVGIYDMTGRKVYNTRINVTEGNTMYTISDAGLNSGMYVIRVTDGTLSGVVKAMIK